MSHLPKVPTPSPSPEAAPAPPEDIVADIKRVFDDMLWRAVSLGNTVLRQYELTLQQALALGAIVRLGPDVEMGRVAESTMLAPSTTTSVVDRLVQRGLLRRTAHPTDRRSVLVSATRTGEYLVQEMDEQDLNSFRWIARGLSDTQLRSIHEAFQHLLEQMDAIRPEDVLPNARHGRKVRREPAAT